MTTVLITGANRGIGLVFARQYAADGATVIATCREPEKADKLTALGVRVEQLDVTDPASATALAVTLKAVPIDILIANAGYYGPELQDADDADWAGFLQTYRVNSLGPLLVAQALKLNLLSGQDKKLVVLTSKMGSIADSTGGHLAYRASKAALNMIAHNLALEWKKHGIKVAILHPGWVKTDMGGSSAPLSAAESVAEMMNRIAELWPGNSGQFLDYQGKEIRW
ncbi:MAG: SDR family oxidoreductase [Rhizomicrobium sp.]|nr:SDR family oxidoreductase [Rhizomicrobium sp.]